MNLPTFKVKNNGVDIQPVKNLKSKNIVDSILELGWQKYKCIFIIAGYADISANLNEQDFKEIFDSVKNFYYYNKIPLFNSNFIYYYFFYY
jgi:hypothetical protein